MWSDGHDTEVIRDYAEMPLELFRRARQAAKWAYSEARDPELKREGPWHYQGRNKSIRAQRTLRLSL